MRSSETVDLLITAPKVFIMVTEDVPSKLDNSRVNLPLLGFGKIFTVLSIVRILFPVKLLSEGVLLYEFSARTELVLCIKLQNPLVVVIDADI